MNETSQPANHMAHDPDTPLPADPWAAARAQWRWRGAGRPAFAVTPGPGQVSVWDFPRPPRIVADDREVIVRFGAVEVARSRRTLRVLETAHPPSFYLPIEDVAADLLQPASGESFCEWKGPATYWTLVVGDRRLPKVAWRYPRPMAGYVAEGSLPAESLAGCIAFYPNDLACSVDGHPVQPQPGGFYGGWITPELVGPYKGGPGSAGW